MHDLMRVAGEKEAILRLQGVEDQRKLGAREVLHFVHDDEIVKRFGLRAPAV